MDVIMKEQNTEVEFLVIGAGLPRTGTTSTFAALEQLLPGKCHHMKRTTNGNGDAIFWPRAERGEVLEEDWKQFIKSEGLSAAVDFPMSLYWKDLMKIYPNAKVLLTVRDPVKWYISVKNTVRQGSHFIKESLAGLPLRTIGKLIGKTMGNALFTCWSPTYLGAKYPQGLFGAVDAGEETAVRFFNDWNEEVINNVPADRLLIFEVKQGWAPLCQFLGLPEPDEPFPNTNDTAQMQKMLGMMRKASLVIWSLTLASVAVAAYYFKDQIPVPTIIFN